MNKNSNNFKIILIIIFIIFVIIRLVSWSNLTGLEDHDSIKYLKLTQFFKDFTLEGFIDLGPDDLVLYPFLSSFLTHLGFSIELSARVISFITSIILFFVFYFFQKKLFGVKVALIGNLILSLNPFLISFSYSVLTEPLYILIIYIGVFYFISQVEVPTYKSAIILGIIIGLSFTARTEGIIFFATIPFMQFIHYLVSKNRNYDFKYFLKWSTIFSLLFILVVFPQVLRVSNKMGTFSINGRTAWMKLLKSDIEKSTDEKIYGLDFNPSKINIHHVQSHPETYHSLKSETKLTDEIKTFIYIFNELYYMKLSSFFGLIGVVFFGIGCFYLVIKRKIFEFLIIFIFIAAALIPPLLHNVVTRHIAIIGPIIIMLHSLGIIYVSDKITETYPQIFHMKLSQFRISLFLILFSVALSGHSLYMSTFKPTYNKEYKKEDFSETIKILKNEIGQTKTKIASRKEYFPHFAGVDIIPTPYTDYNSLINYLKTNNTKFIFIEYKHLKEFPFISNFLTKQNQDFKLLDSRNDSFGNKIELYKIN